jgi:PAS domain S-box-containing protein
MAADGEGGGSGEALSEGWSSRFDSVSQSLRGHGPGSNSFDTIVALMQESRLPTLLAWGPDLRVLYNEAFAAALGGRHPALGAPLPDLWPDMWSTMEAAVRRALRGQPCTVDDVPVPGATGRLSDQRWFTLSFTRAAGDGRRSGLLCVATETTEHMTLERRHVFELLLSDQLRSVATSGEIAAHACRLLGQHLAAARVSYIQVSAGGEGVRVVQDWTDGELASLAGRELSARDFGTRALAQLRAGRVIRINDFAKDHDGGDTGWDSDFVCVQSHSMLGVPLFRNGRLSAVLQIDDTAARRWSDDEVALATELAERTASALEEATADEGRRRREQDLRTSVARQAFQLELADRLRPLTDPEAIVEAATALLGQHLAVSRVLYADTDDDQGTALVRSDWTAPGVASLAGVQRRLEDFGSGTIAALRRGEHVVVEDVGADPRTQAHEPSFTALGVRAFVLVPLLQAGRPGIVLAVHDSRPRAWQPVDLQRAADVAERTWLALDAARAHAALRAERDQTRYVLDTIAEGFLLVDGEGRIAQINAEGQRIGNVKAQEVLGRPAWDVWPGLRDSKLAELYRDVRASGRAAAVEYRRRRGDVQPTWIEVRALPALHGGTAVFYRDIDERKRAEEQLQEADRRKNEFLAMLAHELRNPLAPIATAAQMLARPGLQAAQLQRTSELLSRQVEQMTRLVDELLDISRITQRLVHLQWEVLDLNEVVPQAVEQVAPLVARREHRLSVHAAGTPAMVRADRQRLVQVISNLLANAAKYTPPGGLIELHVECGAADVSLSVRDNGIGMTPGLIACAFELFTQAERGDQRATQGLGIGLALVRGIVDLFGGSVSAHSEGLGHGSEFVVVLPRVDSAH